LIELFDELERFIQYIPEKTSCPSSVFPIQLSRLRSIPAGENSIEGSQRRKLAWRKFGEGLAQIQNAFSAPQPSQIDRTAPDQINAGSALKGNG
jgi:hypothetical protein